MLQMKYDQRCIMCIMCIDLSIYKEGKLTPPSLVWLVVFSLVSPWKLKSEPPQSLHLFLFFYQTDLFFVFHQNMNVLSCGCESICPRNINIFSFRDIPTWWNSSESKHITLIFINLFMFIICVFKWDRLKRNLLFWRNK